MDDAAILPLVTAGRDRRRQVLPAASPAQQPIRIVIADSQPLMRLAYEPGLVVARHGVSAPFTTAMIVAA